jgi:hypothetical protein
MKIFVAVLLLVLVVGAVGCSKLLPLPQSGEELAKVFVAETEKGPMVTVMIFSSPDQVNRNLDLNNAYFMLIREVLRPSLASESVAEVLTVFVGGKGELYKIGPNEIKYAKEHPDEDVLHYIKPTLMKMAPVAPSAPLPPVNPPPKRGDM